MDSLSNWIKSLKSSYPNPNNWSDYRELIKSDVFRFSRLWLCEGIPYAFRDNAAVYELARENFGKKLGEHPKNISMTGSGRIGYSLSSKKFGNIYDPQTSDVDLFLVSEKWFLKIKEDAELFISRVCAGIAESKNEFEEKTWKNNVIVLEKNIPKGFVNQHFIPKRERYDSARTCYIACEAFRRTFISQGINNSPKKVTVRVYRSWENVERQIGGSLLYALKENKYNII